MYVHQSWLQAKFVRVIDRKVQKKAFCALSALAAGENVNIQYINIYTYL